MTAVGSDAAAAVRVMRAVPADATWLTTLSQQMPMHRIRCSLGDDVRAALQALRRPDIRFTDPDLADAHRHLVNALIHLVDEFDGTYAPDSPGPVTYTEVPPEWKRIDRNRYDQALRDLSRARDTVLDRYEELMTTMSSTGNMPSPQDPAPAQGFTVSSGDHSPINLNAAHATNGATASAGTNQPTASSPSVPWYRSNLFYTAISAIGTVGATVIAYFALVK
ncbi:hypothetical protein [Streptomyces sp. NPDC005181]|uniref:hypothetical protein n=1 Tax=Streptomyces sp. NPDC005181 TaxID=3156869 RepID=UPI0033B118A6